MVDHTKEIVKYYKLDERAEFAVIAAAWFHDTGQLSLGYGITRRGKRAYYEILFRKQNVDAALDRYDSCMHYGYQNILQALKPYWRLLYVTRILIILEQSISEITDDSSKKGECN